MKPATPGSLPAEVLADLVALRNFVEGRDRALEVLFDRKLPRSHLRDELIRIAVIEFGFGRLHTIGHYRRSCAHLGKPLDVRNEIDTLCGLGLLILLPGEGRRPGWHICPTAKLVEWYCSHMPRLMKEVRRYMSARTDELLASIQSASNAPAGGGWR